MRKIALVFLTISLILIIFSIDLARQSILTADGQAVPTILGFWILGNDTGWSQSQFITAFYWTGRFAFISLILFLISDFFDLR
jgi:riboflavin transporter FmnP